MRGPGPGPGVICPSCRDSGSPTRDGHLAYGDEASEISAFHGERHGPRTGERELEASSPLSCQVAVEGYRKGTELP